jgi:hypothetical protein
MLALKAAGGTGGVAKIGLCGLFGVAHGSAKLCDGSLKGEQHLSHDTLAAAMLRTSPSAALHDVLNNICIKHRHAMLAQAFDL